MEFSEVPVRVAAFFWRPGCAVAFWIFPKRTYCFFVWLQASSGMSWFFPSLITIYTWLGLIIFLGIGIWEANQMKRVAAGYVAQGNVAAANQQKFAIFWALQCYITFVNILLFMLRIFGGGGSR